MIADNAYNRIKAMIYRGRLQPGRRLVERDLAQQLGVSRIPVREGLARLASEGLVRSVPRSGTYVQSLEPSDILEIYSMRLMLEPPATRMAARNASPPLIAQLNELAARIHEQSKAGEEFDASQTDYDFHLAIIHASGHKRLIRAYESCHIQIVIRADYGDKAAVLPQEADLYTDQHARIVDCLQRRRPQLAERLAYDHVLQATERAEATLGQTLEHD